MELPSVSHKLLRFNDEIPAQNFHSKKAKVFCKKRKTIKDLIETLILEKICISKNKKKLCTRNIGSDLNMLKIFEEDVILKPMFSLKKALINHKSQNDKKNEVKSVNLVSILQHGSETKLSLFDIRLGFQIDLQKEARYNILELKRNKIKNRNNELQSEKKIQFEANNQNNIQEDGIDFSIKQNEITDPCKLNLKQTTCSKAIEKKYSENSENYYIVQIKNETYSIERIEGKLCANIKVYDSNTSYISVMSVSNQIFNDKNDILNIDSNPNKKMAHKSNGNFQEYINSSISCHLDYAEYKIPEKSHIIDDDEILQRSYIDLGAFYPTNFEQGFFDEVEVNPINVYNDLFITEQSDDQDLLVI